jgi:N-acetylneuraminate synthase
MKSLNIGNRVVGDNAPNFISAEIGINHNGSLDTTYELIDIAVATGCDAVKFQKRTVDVVYSAEELERPRDSVFGDTNGDLKHGLEFDADDYEKIDEYCKEKNIMWYASPWDEESVDFLEQFDLPCHKVASASLTDDALLRKMRATGRPILLSTGMSSLSEIDHAVEVLGKDDLLIYHCTSTYPSDDDELNLDVIPVLRERYGVPIGYSGHESGIASSLVAAALGACAIERHITVSRSLWGSDQAASLEPEGIRRLVRDIRLIPTWRGDGKKKVYDSEIPIREKLRRIG